jgi:hypothetical protein
MNEDEIDEVIRDQMLCRIAFKGKDYPYIAQFQYVFMNDTLYFHFTDYGRKMKLLARYKPDVNEYNFVVLRGSIEIVDDPHERARVITKMADEGRSKLSRNFLAAHGFNKEEGWSALSPEKPLIVAKLGEVVEKIGLKAPSS